VTVRPARPADRSGTPQRNEDRARCDPDRLRHVPARDGRRCPARCRQRV